MQPVVQMKNITKIFNGVVANDSIDFEVFKGEIHGLVGENGAGKTTLMKILYGLLEPDSGDIFINGKVVRFNSPRDAINHKIGMVSQHFSLIPNLTVAENVALGDIPKTKVLFWDKESTEKKVSELAKKCGFDIDPLTKVGKLSVGQQQHVEIMKALYKGAEILILDEPTSSLSPHEVERLFELLREMCAQDFAIILITHKTREVMMTERVTVLRGGEIVLKEKTSNLSEEMLTEAMFGAVQKYEKSKRAAKMKRDDSRAILKVHNLCVPGVKKSSTLKKVSFQVHEGEIFGVAGIVGNGQSELIEVLTGHRSAGSGSIILEGEDVLNFSPKQLRERRLIYIPEDTRRTASFGGFALTENVILGKEEKEPFARHYIHRILPIAAFTRQVIKDYEIKCSGINMLAQNLSGGNLQKLVLSREFSIQPVLIIACQPTRGLDLKTAEFVKSQLFEAKNNGCAVIYVSYDLEEIMEMSDTIGVMFEGTMRVVSTEEVGDIKQLGKMMIGYTAAETAQA